MQPTLRPEYTYYASAHAPKKQRNYVKIVLVGWLFAFMTSLIILGGTTALAPAGASQAQASTPTQADIFYVQKVNELRAKKGLKPVRLLQELNQSSNNKVTDMVANHYWSHFAPNNGPTFSSIIWERVPVAEEVGENLARCYLARSSAFDALVASPTHYAIMVGNFNYMGVSEAYDANLGCTIMAMHFARI